MYEVIIYPDFDNALIDGLITDIKKSGDQKKYADLKKYLKNLSKFGFQINTRFKAQAFKKITSNLYELRPPNFRIFFTEKDDIFYILHGFYKKTQKTPLREISKAKKYVKIIHKK